MDRGQVEDDLRAGCAAISARRGRVADVGDEEADIIAHSRLGAEAEVVERDHLVAGLGEPPAEAGADESATACDQRAHQRSAGESPSARPSGAHQTRVLQPVGPERAHSIAWAANIVVQALWCTGSEPGW